MASHGYRTGGKHEPGKVPQDGQVTDCNPTYAGAGKGTGSTVLQDGAKTLPGTGSSGSKSDSSER